MDDPIVDIKEEFHDTHITLPSGKVCCCKSKTTYTHYASGRKDCKIEIEKPLGVFGLPDEL